VFRPEERGILPDKEVQIRLRVPAAGGAPVQTMGKAARFLGQRSRRDGEHRRVLCDQTRDDLGRLWRCCPMQFLNHIQQDQERLYPDQWTVFPK
jgi:hypothetical protein